MNETTLTVSRKSALLNCTNNIIFVGGLYFILNGTTYSSGATVPITSIGVINGEDAGSSLVCVTRNVNTMCCRGNDGGNVGEWHFPNGSIVPRNSASPNGDFTRSGFTHQVRLNRRNNALTPYGIYTCVVPDGNDGVNHTANITLSGIY